MCLFSEPKVALGKRRKRKLNRRLAYNFINEFEKVMALDYGNVTIERIQHRFSAVIYTPDE
jgi:hypothetical protein